MSDSWTKAKRLPRAEVRSFCRSTMPARRKRVALVRRQRRRADRPSAGCRRARGSCRTGRAGGSTGRSRSRANSCCKRSTDGQSGTTGRAGRARKASDRRSPRRGSPGGSRAPRRRGSPGAAAGRPRRRLCARFGFRHVERAGLGEALELPAVEALGVEPARRNRTDPRSGRPWRARRRARAIACAPTP